MPEKEAILAKHRLIICPACQKPSRLPVAITEGMLPVRLKCPSCSQYTLEFKNNLPTNLPKVEPPKVEQWWIVEACEKMEEDEEEDSSGSLPVPESIRRMGTFHSRADQLRRALFNGLTLTHQLATDITNFELAFYNHFLESTLQAEFLRDNWQPQYLRQFIERPFGVIPIKCDDQLAAQYTRLVMSPKFCTPNVGIPLPSTGAFRLELVNQFSLASRPIASPAMRDSLGLPPQLDLYVTGNKLFGSSLEHCWNDIPGLLEDHGHTVVDPSVVFHPQYSQAAREWLVQHGCKPWGEKQVPGNYIKKETEELSFSQAEGTEDPLFLSAWNTLVETSRLGIFWYDLMRARRFAVAACNAIKGAKMIITTSDQEEAAWQALGAGKGRRGVDQFLFCNVPVGGYPPNIDICRDVRVIVLDHLYHVNYSLLRMLHQYDGILIVLSCNPFLDFNSTNVIAPALYGLVREVSYDEAGDINLPLNEARPPHGSATAWDNPIMRSLMALRGKQIEMDYPVPSERDEAPPDEVPLGEA